ncbi:hypothetical protein [Bradyrhizobium elkanii]|uniref:Uncharacterized protein n=1 Tax=Bradyrhizobium elkanii TaxID=29448 RepID=A0A8I1Y8Q4_BRAEL|nr:hypothetical protein [Bradyrhizobium elkanii]MBP1294315.1 hypothetical protein [Bradyrhizobium elkanii]
MAFVRVEITAKVVQEAARAAAERRAGTGIWADTRLPYLQIRQRAGAAKWVVRFGDTLRSIGDIRERHPEFLSVTDARKAATDTYTELRYGEPETPVSTDDGWTWADLDREYQAMIAQPRWVNRRMKPPSAGTCDDVRLAFAKPSFTALHTKRLTDLDRPQIHAARDAIKSHRQKEKNIAYFRAAMNWAADKHPDASGLHEGVDRWWDHLSAGDPDTGTMHAIEERRRVHRQRKADLDVKGIGAVLARHEAYCAGRTAEDKISPGIRWGLWWVCLTANRRASTVQLRRADFLEQDPMGEDGWGRAAWPPSAMKAKTEFWLPLPGVVRDIAAGSIADYTQLVANEHGDWPSQWVFASTRRFGRDPENDDVSVYPNSLNRHIQRMRDADALGGLPHFSLHLVRSAMGDFIAEHVSGVVSSLVLAHTLPQDEEEAAPTTRQYYLTSQRMTEKAAGMKAWSDAVVAAYLAAGGTMPEPREERRKSKLKRQPPDSRPGAISG